MRPLNIFLKKTIFVVLLVVITLKAYSLPDLTIVNYPTLTETMVLAGGNTTVSFVVKNIGLSDAVSSFTSIYLSPKNYFDNTAIWLADYSCLPIKAGDSSGTLSKIVTFPNGISIGNYYVLVIADGTGTLTESNELNQTSYIAATVTNPMPDLIVQNSPTLSNNSVVKGGSTSISYSILNRGTAASSSCSTSIYISTKNYYDNTAVWLADNSCALLGPGMSTTTQTKTISFSSIQTIGNYYILVYADAKKSVPESNENNQVGFVAISIVQPKPDLTISNNPILGRRSVFSGDTTSVSFKFLNNGVVSASSSMGSIYITSSPSFIIDSSAILLTNISCPSISAGAAGPAVLATITIPPLLASGNYYILIVADRLGYVDESNENNQIAVLPIFIGGPVPDLTILTAPNLTSNNVVIGGKTSVSYAVSNLGFAPSKECLSTFYISTKNYYDNTAIWLSVQIVPMVPVGTIPVNQSKLLSLPQNLIPGNYFILVQLDFHDLIQELKETNQVNYAPISILPQTHFGKVSISLNPTPVNLLGAFWKVDEGNWNPSGDTQSTAVGTHTISFKTVQGYTSPEKKLISVLSSSNFIDSAKYTLGNTAEISIDKSELTFLDKCEGDTQKIKIANNGNSDLIISPFQFKQNSFSANLLLPKIISPNSTFELSVCFNPTTNGIYLSNLVLYSNDSNHKELSIQLIGKCIQNTNVNVSGFVTPTNGYVGEKYSWTAVLSGDFGSNTTVELLITNPVTFIEKSYLMTQTSSAYFVFDKKLDAIGNYTYRYKILPLVKYSEYFTNPKTIGRPLLNDYPTQLKNPNCYTVHMTDPWGFERSSSTSWVAWKVNQALGEVRLDLPQKSYPFNNTMLGGYFGEDQNWKINAEVIKNTL